MKTLRALLLGLALVATLTACGGDDDDSCGISAAMLATSSSSTASACTTSTVIAPTLPAGHVLQAVA